jgi:hypothetical protein
MLQPTIYIPSRITRLLASLAFPQPQVLPAIAGLLGQGGRSPACPPDWRRLRSVERARPMHGISAAST